MLKNLRRKVFQNSISRSGVEARMATIFAALGERDQ